MGDARLARGQCIQARNPDTTEAAQCQEFSAHELKLL
jgi:hypothetical protein